MNAWHQGESQGRKRKFTDLSFFLSFLLSFFRLFSLLLLSPTPVFLCFVCVVSVCLFSALISHCLFTTHSSLHFLHPLFQHLSLHTAERKPHGAKATGFKHEWRRSPLSLLCSITVFLILLAALLSFPVTRHIRVYWCCKCSLFVVCQQRPKWKMLPCECDITPGARC